MDAVVRQATDLAQRVGGNVLDAQARVRVTRDADGALEVHGLSESEAVVFAAVRQAVDAYLVSKAADVAADVTVRTVQAMTAGLGAQIYEVARTAAEQVCNEQIVTRVKTIQRNADGTVIGLVDEPAREV